MNTGERWAILAICAVFILTGGPFGIVAAVVMIGASLLLPRKEDAP